MCKDKTHFSVKITRLQYPLQSLPVLLSGLANVQNQHEVITSTVCVYGLYRISTALVKFLDTQLLFKGIYLNTVTTEVRSYVFKSSNLSLFIESEKLSATK